MSRETMNPRQSLLTTRLGLFSLPEPDEHLCWKSRECSSRRLVLDEMAVWFRHRSSARLCVSVVVATLLAWLVYEGSPVESRKRAINKALSEGRVGGLGEQDSQNLLRTIEWLAAAAGTDAHIYLNQPYSFQVRDQGGLQVYTTTALAERATFCGPGNAVYDAQLDAIFIDDGIVRPLDWQKLLATPDGGWGLDIPLTLGDAPWLRVYMRFIILHELGHRQMHRHLGTSFDLLTRGSSAEQRKRETEADEFAVAKMNAAYHIAGQNGISPVEEYTGDTINYSVTDKSPIPDQVQASLVEMANAMMAGRLMLPSSTAPFRESVSHPSYLDRSRGLVEQSLQRQDISPDLRIFTEYVNQSLGRMQQARRSGVVELTSDEPIAGIQFDERGLLIVTKGIFHRVAVDELHRLVENDQAALLYGVAQSLRVDPVTFGIPSGTALAGLWSAPNVGTVILWSNGHESILSPDLRKVRSSSQGVVQDGLVLDRVVIPQQPSPDAVAIGHDGSSVVWIISFRNEVPVKHISAVELERLAGEWGSPEGGKFDLEHGQIVGGSLYVPLVTREDDAWNIYGYAQVSLATLRPVLIKRLRIPAEMRRYTSSQYNPLIAPESGDREIAFVPSNSQVVPVLINVVRYQPTDKMLSGRGIKWEAWRLTSDSAPSFITGDVFLADYFNRRLTAKGVDNLGITPRLPPGAVTVLAPDRVILNVDRDSIYLVDLRDNSSRLVFHPGSETITIRAAGNDMIALFARGGYRVFLLRLIGRTPDLAK